MKLKLFTIFLFGVQMIFAQTFTPVPLEPPFADVEHSSFAFSDVDGDGDEDVLITGLGDNVVIAALFTNDGSGNFTEVLGTPFEGIYFSSLAFADVDGDNDQDVIIVGLSGSGDRVSRFYTNDGGGNFSEILGTPFEGVLFGSVAFSDVDGDNDQDVLITGRNTFGIRIAKLYNNDGLGNFTEAMGTPFEGAQFSSIAFSDVDGDNDEDVLITGQNSNGLIAKLYTNNGNGIFSEDTGTPFDGMDEGSIAFADVDGDNDQDLLMTGRIFVMGSGSRIAKLYTNDGNGNFTEVLGTPFEGVVQSFITFSDVDGDNDEDVLIMGQNAPNSRISKLYINDGGGVFTEVLGTTFENLDRGAFAFSDVDGDNDQDVLMTGQNMSSNPFTELYINDGAANYTEAMGIIPFGGVSMGSLAFSDVDADNDMDVLLTGSNGTTPTSVLYTNNGSGVFTEVAGTPFEGVELSSIAFSDVDGDNDEDVFITGSDGILPISVLYTNDGNGIFVEVMGTPFEGVQDGSIAFSDVDGDNDHDVFVTGSNGSLPISRLYSNDGSGVYSEIMGSPFVGVQRGSIAFADVDGDNDEDVFITGSNGTLTVSKLYTNDGLGTFTEAMGSSFEGVQDGSIAFADVDGDNDKDVLITGSNGTSPIAKLYTNDGSGLYSESMGTLFEGVENGSIVFFDADGDNDEDVLLSGRNGSDNQIAKLYTNDGSGNFFEYLSISFEGVDFSFIAFSDVDADDDTDVLLTGRNRFNTPISRLYINESLVSSAGELLSAPGFDFAVYPNPAEGKRVTIAYDSQVSRSLTIYIFDLNGRLLLEQEKRSSVGHQEFSIDITSLIQGSYILQLDDGARKESRNLIIY